MILFEYVILLMIGSAVAYCFLVPKKVVKIVQDENAIVLNCFEVNLKKSKILLSSEDAFILGTELTRIAEETKDHQITWEMIVRDSRKSNNYMNFTISPFVSDEESLELLKK